MSTFTTVVGRLTGPPSVYRVGEKETTKVVLRVASSGRRRDPITQDWIDCDQLYVNVNCWRVLGQNVATLTKGDPVIVHGKLLTREWDDADGTHHQVIEIDASAVGPDLSKCVVSAMRRLRPEIQVEPTGAMADRSDEGEPGTYSGSITEALTADEQLVPEPV